MVQAHHVLMSGEKWIKNKGRESVEPGTAIKKSEKDHFWVLDHLISIHFGLRQNEAISYTLKQSSYIHI